MSCPIVYREVDIGGFSRRIEVAVNQRDELNLLGMNYFYGMKYIVDPQNACIYIWEEQSIEIPKIDYIRHGSNPENLTVPVGSERQEMMPNDKENPGGLGKLDDEVSSRDISDLARLADNWLDIEQDANDNRERQSEPNSIGN
jgi:hypothetical protein